LILDNLTNRIESADKRTDLKPVYSFNAEHLWLAKERGRSAKAGRSQDINLWRDLNSRIQRELSAATP